MKKINKTFLVIALLTAALFGNCKCKKDPDPKPAEPIVPLEDLTAYSYFKKGTYWIYKDSTTGVEDSMYVYSDTSYSYYQNNGIQKEGNYMYYDCRAHSYYSGYNYYYRISMGYYGTSTSGNVVGVERTKTNPSVGSTYLMSNLFADGSFIHLYTSSGIVYFKEKWPTFNVLGNNFSNTVKFFDSKNPSEFNSPTNFYIAKNIGIVRSEKLDSNKVWNIVRYHINQ
jgi:hypothetical protein